MIVALVGALMVLLSSDPVGDELVVVLPSADGHVGTVIVQRQGETAVLNEAYATSRIVAGTPLRAGRLSVGEVRSEFAVALEALPVGDELVVVLPSADGHVGTVVVERRGETAVLNQAYAASRIVDGSPPQPERLSAGEVRGEFAVALEALPDRPKLFLVGDELVVLLPSADGHVGTVVVERRGETAVLNQAYAASRIVDGSPPRPERLSASEVRSEFGVALYALPSRPKSFLVYFLEGTDEFTAESRVEFERILAELRERGAPDVVVIGHTDRAGSAQFNDRLSLQRAERVRGELMQLGIPDARIRTAGRGEREPLVVTDDDVAEPRNRRVEINVR